MATELQISGLPAASSLALTNQVAMDDVTDVTYKFTLAQLNAFLLTYFQSTSYSTTATAAALTTLTASSNFQQYFTGVTTQTVKLPVASTMYVGQSFYVVNNSTGAVTIESSGTNSVLVMAANTAALVTCILASGTTAASWNVEYSFQNPGTMATQNASAVNIAGGSASFSTLKAPLQYSNVTGDASLAVTNTYQAFVFTSSPSDMSDGLGLSHYTDGFTFYLKNDSNGNCTFTPFSGEFIDGLSVLTLYPQDGYVITKCTDQWSIIASQSGSSVNNNITSMTGLTGYLAAPLGFKDASGNILFASSYQVNSVNYFLFQNAPTGSAPAISATGSDSAVPFNFQAKNDVFIFEDSTSTIGARIRLFNAAGTFYTGIGCATEQGASYDATLPGADGSASTSLITNGSGVWSFLTKPSFTSINIQRVTATGAGTYTPTTGMKFVIVQAQAGGGGGGGAATASATQFAIASGGGGGEYIEALFTAANIGTSKAFSVGASAAGGLAGNNAGTAGNNTTFNTSWIVATGGGAGVGGASAAASQIFQTAGGSGNGGSVATGTLIKQIPGGSYSAGFAFVTQGIASTGGASANAALAAGSGAITSTTLAGTTAIGATGGGGSGAATYNGGTQQAGGNGAAGFINFIEFINV